MNELYKYILENYKSEIIKRKNNKISVQLALKTCHSEKIFLKMREENVFDKYEFKALALKPEKNLVWWIII